MAELEYSCPKTKQTYSINDSAAHKKWNTHVYGALNKSSNQTVLKQLALTIAVNCGQVEQFFDWY